MPLRVSHDHVPLGGFAEDVFQPDAEQRGEITARHLAHTSYGLKLGGQSSIPRLFQYRGDPRTEIAARLDIRGAPVRSFGTREILPLVEYLADLYQGDGCRGDRARRRAETGRVQPPRCPASARSGRVPGAERRSQARSAAPVRIRSAPPPPVQPRPLPAPLR